MDSQTSFQSMYLGEFLTPHDLVRVRIPKVLTGNRPQDEVWCRRCGHSLHSLDVPDYDCRTGQCIEDNRSRGETHEWEQIPIMLESLGWTHKGAGLHVSDEDLQGWTNWRCTKCRKTKVVPPNFPITTYRSCSEELMRKVLGT